MFFFSFLNCNLASIFLFADRLGIVSLNQLVVCDFDDSNKHTRQSHIVNVLYIIIIFIRLESGWIGFAYKVNPQLLPGSSKVRFCDL